MENSLFLQQSQKIIFTQSMKQGLYLLKLNLIELEEFLENEIDQNPFLEKISNSKRLASFDIASETSRFEHLIAQAKQIFSKNELSLAENIIGNLDDWGFYPQHPMSRQEEKVLKLIQTFDPVGIAAFDLKESLLIQLKSKDKMDSLAYRIIKDYYHHLLHKKWDFILKECKCKKQDLLDAIYTEIGHLNFAPGKNFEKTHVQIKSCDLIIQKKEENFLVIVQDPIHFQMVNPYESCAKYASRWIKQNKRPVFWLMKNLENRKRLLTLIGNILIEHEREFFEWREEIQPISIKEIAIECNVHPTTIHRTLYNKYLKCPRGIFPLNTFFKKSVENTFGEKISNQAILQKVKKMIQKESKVDPLSDQKIVAKLQMQNIKIARRTVAKYRNLLKIPTVSYRKRSI